MADLYWILGLISRGEKAKALTELARILREDPKNIEAWSLMAHALEDPQKKKDCFRQILKLDPNNELARNALEAANKAPESGPVLPLASITEPLHPAVSAAIKLETDPLAALLLAPETIINTPILHAPTAQPAPATPPPAIISAPTVPPPAALPLAVPLPANTPPLTSQDTATLALALTAKGKNKEALKVLDEGLQIYPEDKTLWNTFLGLSPSPEHSLAVIQRWLEKYPQSPAILEAQEAVNKEILFLANEGCMMKALYLFVGTLSLMLLILIMQLPSLIVNGKMAESGNIPSSALEGLAYLWAMVFALVIFFIMLFTLLYGSRGTWLGRMKDNILKWAVCFFLLFIPVGWYFMGRGIYIFFFVDMGKRKE